MRQRERLSEAHTRTKEFANELASDGIPDEDIIDALLVTGSNAYGRITGPAQLANTLRQLADEIDTRGVATGQTN